MTHAPPNPPAPSAPAPNAPAPNAQRPPAGASYPDGPGPDPTSGMVRVTVASGSRRVDLLLPGGVPVAELAPELARSVGLLDAATVYAGYRLVTTGGRELAADAGLTIQGVEDGAVVTVVPGVIDPAPKVYDDVVEAMADVVEHDLEPWSPVTARRTALAAAALLMTLGAVALVIQRHSVVASVAAGLVACVLVLGAVALSRSQREPAAAVAVAWMGVGYAAVAGLLVAWGADVAEDPLTTTGGAVLLVGLLALLGLGDGRVLMLPAVVVGAILGAAGLAASGPGWDPAVVLTSILVLVVLSGSIFPWLALAATGTDVEQLYSVADVTADPADIDARQVGADARTAHEILVGVTATVGLLLVLVAPFAVSLGLAGMLLGVATSVVVMLRTRQYRTGSEVLAGLASGVLGLGSVAVSMLVLHPDWRPEAAIGLAAAGTALLVATLVPRTPSVRSGRWGDLAESVGLVALLPLLVVATGLLAAVRGS